MLVCTRRSLGEIPSVPEKSLELRKAASTTKCRLDCRRHLCPFLRTGFSEIRSQMPTDKLGSEPRRKKLLD
jgi:hypothetical protein